jgi:hypothetical protein
MDCETRITKRGTQTSTKKGVEISARGSGTGIKKERKLAQLGPKHTMQTKFKKQKNKHNIAHITAEEIAYRTKQIHTQPNRSPNF